LIRGDRIGAAPHDFGDLKVAREGPSTPLATRRGPVRPGLHRPKSLDGPPGCDFGALRSPPARARLGRRQSARRPSRRVFHGREARPGRSLPRRFRSFAAALVRRRERPRPGSSRAGYVGRLQSALVCSQALEFTQNAEIKISKDFNGDPWRSDGRAERPRRRAGRWRPNGAPAAKAERRAG
jgi:hypothetical protein